MPSARHTPMRRCVACREAAPKRELVRLMSPPSGGYALDLTQRAGGRGSSLCVRCASAVLAGDNAVQLRGFKRVFKQHAEAVMTLLRPLEATLLAASIRSAGSEPAATPAPTATPAPLAPRSSSRPNGGMHG